MQAGWDVLEVTPNWTPERLRRTVLAKVADAALRPVAGTEPNRLITGWPVAQGLTVQSPRLGIEGHQAGHANGGGRGRRVATAISAAAARGYP